MEMRMAATDPSGGTGAAAACVVLAPGTRIVAFFHDLDGAFFHDLHLALLLKAPFSEEEQEKK